MATDFEVDPDHARADLAAMQADRLQLTGRLATPWPLMVASGAALAWFVADAAQTHPGAGYEAGSGWLASVAVLCLVAHLVQRETGVRFRRLGAKGGLAPSGLAVWTLAMFSCSLAVVSTGHRAWVAVPVLLTWVVGTLGSAAVFSSCVGTMRRG